VREFVFESCVYQSLYNKSCWECTMS